MFEFGKKYNVRFATTQEVYGTMELVKRTGKIRGFGVNTFEVVVVAINGKKYYASFNEDSKFMRIMDNNYRAFPRYDAVCSDDVAE